MRSLVLEFHRVRRCIACTANLIIQQHGLSHHSFADDTQLYMTMDHSNNNWRYGLARIQLCVSDIREWMNQNMLKLNDDKTELIVFTTKYKQDLYNDLSITIGDTVVDCSSQVKDIGVIFDRVLSLRQHFSYTPKTCRFHLRNISRIRKYIPHDTSVVLVKSIVMMYCFWIASGSKLCCTHCSSGKAPKS